MVFHVNLYSAELTSLDMSLRVVGTNWWECIHNHAVARGLSDCAKPDNIGVVESLKGSSVMPAVLYTSLRAFLQLRR